MSTTLSCIHTQLAISKNTVHETTTGVVEVSANCRSCNTDLVATFEAESSYVTEEEPHTANLEVDSEGGLSVFGTNEDGTRTVEFGLVGFQPDV